MTPCDVSIDVRDDVRPDTDFRPAGEPVRMRRDVWRAWRQPRDECASCRNIGHRERERERVYLPSINIQRT